MKYVLFSVRDSVGSAVGVAGASESGVIYDPVFLEGRSVDEVAKDLKDFIKKADENAVVTFTEQPDSHPIVISALKRNAEEEEPEIKVEGFLCQTCTHARVCAVASAIMTLRTVDVRVTSCEAYVNKEKEPPDDREETPRV